MIGLNLVSALLLVALPGSIASPSRLNHKHTPRSCNSNGGNNSGNNDTSGAGDWAHHATYTFTGNSLPDGLFARGDGADPTSVSVKDGYLVLTVPGTDTATHATYKSEVATTADNILYGSVRIVAILTETPGVCNGMFFYKSDTQEADIEWLSDHTNESDDGTSHIWFTNQDANGDGKTTNFKVAPPSNPTSTEHEYRIDWTEGRVQWFIDGVQQAETDQDVPSEPGPWMWNNWYNGNKGWSAGPPASEAIFRIKSIDMYYNTV